MNHNETEVQLLEAIYACQDEAERTSQRSLADRAGMSLGMTNALLRRFIERGWVKLMHISGRSLKYILTPNGLEQILRKSVSYFSRAARSASLYRSKIDAFVRCAARDGFTLVVFEGPQELDFLFEHACGLSKIEFYKNPSEEKKSSLLRRSDVLHIQANLQNVFNSEDSENRFERARADSRSVETGESATAVTLTEILFTNERQAVNSGK